MRSWWGLLFVGAVSAGVIALFSSVTTTAVPAQGADDLLPGRYIVILKPGVDPEDFAGRLGSQLGFTREAVYRVAVRGFVANLPDRAVQALRRDPNVELVEQDRILRVADQTLPTGMDRIDLEQNAAAAVDGADNPVDADIAIIDTGVDTAHPDLNVVGGIRFSGSFFLCTTGGSYDDDNGHGTHVAGIAAARDNGDGVVGVAPGARIWAVKVLDANGSGPVSCILQGVDWVTAHAATIKVANMSLGGGNSPALCSAIANSAAAGVVYAVAAGNSSVDASTQTPANCSQALAVSAMADFDGLPGGLGSPTCRQDGDDTFANFSNFGSAVDIAAPGVCILSTWNDGGYKVESGTSMASPHVAGAVALFRATTGYSGPADGRSVVAAMTAAGWTRPQNSECGFTGDPDAFPEPMLYLGGSCSSEPLPTPTPSPASTATPTRTPTAVPSATPSATPSPTPQPGVPSATPAPTQTPGPTPLPGQGGVPNGDFESAGYDTGTPPPNYDFESGTLAPWTPSGAVSVQQGGPSGSYARLPNVAFIVSAPFVVAPDAQTFTVDVGFFAPNSCIGVEILAGPNFPMVAQLPADCGTSAWHTKSVNVTQWAGQTIEVRLRGAGTTGIDNAGVMHVVLDRWDVSGAAAWIPERRNDGPSANYGRVPNAVSPVSAAFQLPAGHVTLSFSRRVSIYGGYNLVVHCGATFAACGRVVTNDSASPGQWLAKSADLSQWQGQVIKLEFVNAGVFDLDSLQVTAQ